jgi:hypothetical protein
MAEQTFKSPGFFEREIEVISRPLTRNTATPVGVIGPAKKGQAFVPKTVTSVDEFIKEFGMPDQDTSASHAISEFFSNGGKAATFCRILGTGNGYGSTQKYAGFKVDGTNINNNRASGAVQFIVASHTVNAAEHVTYGIFNDNDSITTTGDTDLSDDVADPNTDKIQLVRAMIFMHKDYTLRIADTGGTLASSAAADSANCADTAEKTFVLWFLNTVDNSSFYKTVSLDPSSSQYIKKVLNTNSFAFADQKHFLYADFPVEDVLATTKGEAVAVVRGKDTDFLDLYGDFTSRFEAPRTPAFISQPFGDKEYDLFYFESLDDGTYASKDYKISITNLRASTQKNYKFGTFAVQLRKIADTDDSPVILESYSRCSLDPDSKNFIGRLIGDQKVYLNLDVDSEDEKRLIREGTFPNKSTRIRVVINSNIVNKEAPSEALPFGYRGIPALRTTSDGKDGKAAGTATTNLIGLGIDDANADNVINHSVLPPLPFRSKVTLGSMTNAGAYFQEYFGQVISSGSKVTNENVKTWLYWGLHTTKVSNIANPNSAGVTEFNSLVTQLTKYLTKSTTLKFSNEDADNFNNNKFSLAKVAFPVSTVAAITGTVSDAFLEAVYIRNADVGSVHYDTVNHTIDMSGLVDPFAEEGNADAFEIRATMAKLLAEDAIKFNKYSIMSKFTAPFYGGFDGVNILDRDDYYFTDKASSTDAGGHAADGGYTSGLSLTLGADPMQGNELNNNAVIAYRNAIRIMTDEMIIDHNVLAIPGIRDSLVTNFAARRVKSYGKALYLMDIPHYASSGDRIYVSSRGVASGVPDIELTSQTFDQRELDSSYVATYFPDVMIRDSGDNQNAALTNHRVVRAPSSVVAIGALARSDSMSGSAPWFAPAGFSRGSLPNVSSIDVRLNAGDRDTLYEARINPIANFPNNQFVIFGQKTTQIARTALDRVNVRRLMINIKRRIQKVAQRLLFEQNDAATRNRFVVSTTKILSDIRVGQGIEDFRVIMDDTNNTDEDVDNNRLNGRIVVVPTRAVEFIAMDFVITNSGVEFPS